jgi:beta-glucosidase/6-phospho-beta-glucosidase/beta-galactosidase
MKFGLYECDWETKERRPKASAAIFSKLAHLKMLDAQPLLELDAQTS